MPGAGEGGAGEGERTEGQGEEHWTGGAALLSSPTRAPGPGEARENRNPQLRICNSGLGPFPSLLLKINKGSALHLC